MDTPLTEMDTQKESWEEYLEYILGVGPEGSFKYERLEAVKTLVRDALQSDRARISSEAYKRSEGRRLIDPDSKTGVTARFITYADLESIIKER